MKKQNQIVQAMKCCLTNGKFAILLFSSILLFTACKTEPTRVNEDNIEEKNGIRYIKGQTKPFTGIIFTESINNDVVKLHEEYNVVDGLLNGKATKYYDNGELKYIGYCKNNKKCGEWIYYDKNGNETERQNFDNDNDTNEKIVTPENDLGNKDFVGTWVRDRNDFSAALKIIITNNSGEYFVETIFKEGMYNSKELASKDGKYLIISSNRKLFILDNGNLYFTGEEYHKALTENTTTGVTEVSKQSEVSNNIETEYFKIQDNDGYSNLRDKPNGKVMRRVLESEKFEIVGGEGEFQKVKLSDGTEGFIHESRIVRAD